MWQPLWTYPTAQWRIERSRGVFETKLLWGFILFSFPVFYSIKSILLENPASVGVSKLT